MGAAESKVAAQPLAVVATAEELNGTSTSTRPPPSRSSASKWTCNLLRKQNKTAPAASRAPLRSLSSSPTVEALKLTPEQPAASTSSPGPSAQLVTTNKSMSLQHLTFEELSTQLLKAVKNGDQRLVERVVEIATTKKWSIVNIRGMWDSTPLLYACQYCHEPIALWLLQQGADVDLVNEKNVSPLLLASLEGMATATQEILTRLAAPSRPLTENHPLLHIDAQVGVVYNSVVDINVRASPLLAASMNGHEAVVTLLLRRGADVNHGVAPHSPNGNKSAPSGGGSRAGSGRGVLQFPLLVAAKYGHGTVAKLLIAHGAEMGKMDGNENHALLLACEAAKQDCALALMQSLRLGHDHAGWKRPNVHGFTALHYCAVHGLTQAAEFMLKDLRWGMDSNFLNATSSTRQESAVLVAARKKQIDIVKLLLQCGANALLPDRGATSAIDVLKRDKRDELVEMWSELQAKTKGTGGIHGESKDKLCGHDDKGIKEDTESPNESAVAPTELCESFVDTSHTAATTQLPENKPEPVNTVSSVASPPENVTLLESTDLMSTSPEVKIAKQKTRPDDDASAAPKEIEPAQVGNEQTEQVVDSGASSCLESVLQPPDPIDEHVSSVHLREHHQDLAPIVPHKAQGNRSKSTSATKTHPRRATGFAVDMKSKAKSLSSLTDLTTANEEEEEEGDTIVNVDLRDQPFEPPKESQAESPRHSEPVESNEASHASTSDAMSVSPSKAKEKQKRKKRHSKKKIRDSSTIEYTNETPTDTIDHKSAAPSSSLCIPEHEDPGDLNDDF